MMRQTIALLLLFAVVAFALPVIASAKSPPSQAIHKQTLTKIDLQNNVIGDAVGTDWTVTHATVKAHSALNSTATFRQPFEHQRLKSRHEQSKYSLPLEGFGLRPVLLC